MNFKTLIIVGAVIGVAVLAAGNAAAQKPVSIAEVVSETFTVEAIDYSTRVVTLKDKAGFSEDVYCGPDVKRFEALKVGDQVTFQYHESLVTSIRRPDSTAKPPEGVTVTRTPGAKPGGTIAQQMTAVVDLEAIDTKVPSVTIKTASGRRMSFKVQDAKNLTGYKAGDKVEVTYTQALAISVK